MKYHSHLLLSMLLVCVASAQTLRSVHDDEARILAAYSAVEHQYDESSPFSRHLRSKVEGYVRFDEKDVPSKKQEYVKYEELDPSKRSKDSKSGSSKSSKGKGSTKSAKASDSGKGSKGSDSGKGGKGSKASSKKGGYYDDEKTDTRHKSKATGDRDHDPEYRDAYDDGYESNDKETKAEGSRDKAVFYEDVQNQKEGKGSKGGYVEYDHVMGIKSKGSSKKSKKSDSGSKSSEGKGSKESKSSKESDSGNGAKSSKGSDNVSKESRSDGEDSKTSEDYNESKVDNVPQPEQTQNSDDKQEDEYDYDYNDEKKYDHEDKDHKYSDDYSEDRYEDDWGCKAVKGTKVSPGYDGSDCQEDYPEPAPMHPEPEPTDAPIKPSPEPTEKPTAAPVPQTSYPPIQATNTRAPVDPAPEPTEAPTKPRRTAMPAPQPTDAPKPEHTEPDPESEDTEQSNAHSPAPPEEMNVDSMAPPEEPEETDAPSTAATEATKAPSTTVPEETMAPSMAATDAPSTATSEGTMAPSMAATGETDAPSTAAPEETDAPSMATSEETSASEPADTASKNIVEIAVETPELSRLVRFLSEPAQEEFLIALMGEGPLTVFAPTNSAFNALTGQVNLGAMDDRALTYILAYHVTSDGLFSNDLETGFVVMLNGDGVYVELMDGAVTLNKDSVVVTADIEASNGVIHLIDQVLLPPIDKIPAIAINNGFDILVDLLQTADLVDVLNGDGPFTVFAPTDAAFEKLGSEVLTALKGDVATLRNVLLYHVVSGFVGSGELVESGPIPTLANSNASIRVGSNGSVLNGNAGFEVTDVIARNGVVHVINEVLIPPAL